MATTPAFQAEQLTFADCRVTSFQLGRPGTPLPNAEDVASFSYTFTSEQGVDFDNAIIRIALHVAIEAKRTDEALPNELVGEIRTETFFRVTGLDALMATEDACAARAEAILTSATVRLS
ncbi:MAG: hypothetical protein EOO58_03210 [Hymenobacter sp.]|nr:MAG: hypothetical protein EOO58_03210 [Hymenobacter sp.]